MDLHPEATRRSIWLLSHVGSHPNIFFTKNTWIKPEAEGLLLPSFRWSPEELARMHEERIGHRATLGDLPLVVLAWVVFVCAAFALRHGGNQ